MKGGPAARARRVAALAGLAASLPLGPSPARAHHGGSIARIDPAATWVRGLGPTEVGVPGPRLNVSIGYVFSRFGRLAEGTGTFDGGEAAVDVHLALVAVSGRLRTGTEFGATLPVGVARSSVDGEGTDVQSGLGDLFLWASHPIRFASARRWFASLHGGVLLPTGRYERDQRVRFRGLESGADGSLDLRAFDTRSSLGAGSTAIRVGVQGGYRATDWLRLWAAVDGTQPLHDTPDGIWWGTDLVAGAGARVALWRQNVALRAGGHYAFHAQDRIPSVEDPLRRDAVGGRDEVAVSAGLEFRWVRAFGCAVAAWVPVWQRAADVQLVQSVRTQASCALAVGL